jgi:transposase
LARAGRKPEELVKEHEPSAQTIRNWVAPADRDEGRREDGLTMAEGEELNRLRSENRQLKLEREILSNRSASELTGRPLFGGAWRNPSPPLTQSRRA